MNKEKIIPFIRGTLAFILGVIITVFCIIIPFYFSITKLVETDTVVSVVQSIDYKEIIDENKSVKKVLKKQGVTPQLADDFIKSEMGGEIIETYANNAFDILADIPSDNNFNADTVKQIAYDNMDSITEIVKKASDNKKLSEKTIKKTVNKIVDKNADYIVESLPDLQEIKTIIETHEISTKVKNSLSTKFIVIMFSAFAICIGAFYFCTKKDYWGFLWLGIIFLIACALLCAIIFFGESALTNALAANLSLFHKQIIDSVLSVCFDRLSYGLYILLAIAFSLLAGYFVLYKFVVKKEKVVQKP